MLNNFKQLAEDSRTLVDALKRKGAYDGFMQLLTNLYPDNAHFIYELLQNAEDAGATEVCFTLEADRVEFEHNGHRLFSFDDVKSITNIGDSTKHDDPTNIGKFGVGFKAVFAYTSTPEIVSGQFHFRIRDLVVPDMEGLSPCNLGEKETRFVFPFDNPPKPPEKARAEIEKNLRQLNEGTLLFLKNIRKIEYRLPDSTLGFLKRKETAGSHIEILTQHPEDSEPVSVFFLRFEKMVGVTDEDGKPQLCRIAVAFGLEKAQGQEKKIGPLDPGRVCIYFPAEKETSNLRFHLHAPFASTVARDSVRDCSANDELRDHLADLIAEAMVAIRDQGLLTVGFLSMLPNNRDNLSPFYKPILNRLVKAFESEDLTPMKKGSHAAAKGIFRGLARLSDLIIDNDLARLLGEEYSPPLWIANPPQMNHREDNFLSMLDISEWTTEHLILRLDELELGEDELELGEDDQAEQITEWLSGKSDKWFQQLYVLLSRELDSDDDLRREILGLKIVRLSDGTYSQGRDCFFPDEEVEVDHTFPRVAKGVYSSGKNRGEQEKVRRFLENIGVREVGEVEQIEAILKQRYSKDSIKPRKQDMKRFVALRRKRARTNRFVQRVLYLPIRRRELGKARDRLSGLSLSRYRIEHLL